MTPQNLVILAKNHRFTRVNKVHLWTLRVATGIVSTLSALVLWLAFAITLFKIPLDDTKILEKSVGSLLDFVLLHRLALVRGVDSIVA